MVASASAGVTVSSPANGSVVSSPVQFVASATSSNSAYPITAMRIYVDNVSAYTVNASSLKTSLSLAGGTHSLVFVAWDASGQAYTKSIGIIVGTASTTVGVTVSSPVDGSVASSPVQFVASAKSSNSAYPITAMRIYVDNVSAYTVKASSINTSLPLAAGSHSLVFVAWDASGASYTERSNISVRSTTLGGVTISSPANGSSNSSPVQFVATATATTGNTITAMRIYVDYISAYAVSSASLNTSLNLTSGTHNIIVQAWDNKGTVYKAAETISVSAPATHSATLGWTPSISSGVVGYNVYRGTISGGPYTRITTAPQSGSSYQDLAVSSGTTYYYVITAVNGSGQESAYSSQVSAVIP